MKNFGMVHIEILIIPSGNGLVLNHLHQKKKVMILILILMKEDKMSSLMVKMETQTSKNLKTKKILTKK